MATAGVWPCSEADSVETTVSEGTTLQ